MNVIAVVDFDPIRDYRVLCNFKKELTFFSLHAFLGAWLIMQNQQNELFKMSM